MITKHFIKTLIAFTALIALGLLGVSLLSYYEKQEAKKNAPIEESVTPN